ncbi:glycosyl transferase, family 2 [Rhodotorula toruloides]|uniref:Glycosyl transferase, family 2 n=1 Tax=Rhodotorula toruloides TaxID=5286 RepID=A0A511K9T5_RHOTO|nr:glycosyl transferase, family 2 [Rhodotorula toruloides]
MKGPLPDFTILLPVYKESLEGVLLPTIRSLQEAIKTGGSVSILVCDDGMQLLDERDFATRKAFYEANAIAYVAEEAQRVRDATPISPYWAQPERPY